jgi:L-galactose dehydrogenase
MGKVRFIGIMGYPLRIFREVLGRAPVDTILSYCRYTRVRGVNG